MYYEVHGARPPLLLLHGAFMAIDLMGPIVPGLAEFRRVITVEQQGHGHTADVDRPMSYEQRIVGDSDGVRLEHAVELFGLLGGGVMGDLAGMPKSQVAVLPGTSHFVPPGSGLLDRSEWLLAMLRPFLDAPLPETS
jgi:hypothetical protein